MTDQFNIEINGLIIGDVMRKSKGGNQDGTSLFPAVHKEWLSMNEKEWSDVHKMFDESRQDLEKWKQKVKEDGRAKRIKNLESSINKRLKILQHDKPKCMRPFVCFFATTLQKWKQGKVHGEMEFFKCSRERTYE